MPISSKLPVRIFNSRNVKLRSEKHGSPLPPFVCYPETLGLALILICILPLTARARERAVKPQPASPTQGVQFQKGPDQIEIRVGGNPFTSYHFRGYNKPIFFPLRTASGKVVTRGWPMISGIQGEAHDHPHHKGLWLTHGSVNGVDFWSEGGKTGKIVHREFLETQEGQQVGILKSLNDWITPTGQKILEELREVRIYSRPGIRILDFDFQLRAVNGPVLFGDTKEGTFGIRLSHLFREESGGRIENSAGGVGETQCWGKQAEWVDFTAQIQGETVGVAILNHPSSFRFPTYWHVRAYTLFAANPFGWHDFLNDPSKDGSSRLEAGQSIIFRYRVIIHSGSTKEAAIGDQFKEYTRDVK